MVAKTEPTLSLENFLTHPPDGTEWVDGQLVEKTDMTFKHGLTQANLAYFWRNHVISSGQRGAVVTEVLCRTSKQVRRPDVAYITAEVLEKLGEFTTLPQSFPLIAEIASPDDSTEALFAKTKEYLQSGCQEVWLVFPESQWIIVATQQQRLVFTVNEVVSTQAVLQGFSLAVDELLA